MLKRPKEEIAANAAANASAAAYSSLSNTLGYEAFRIGDVDFKYVIQSAISQAVYQAIQVTLQEIYTQDEFEQDIGLK